MTAPTLNGLRAIAVRLFLMWRGAWIADVEIDPDNIATVPTTGAATLLVGGVTLTGTVDPRGSGTFSGKASVRVVGGAGGWDQTVPAQHFHEDTGVSSTSVYQATASIVHETVNDLAPVTLGIDVIRTTGAASRIFGAADWWVDLTGITNVGARPAATADQSLIIADFAPLEQRVDFSCDALLLPNTTLSDPRFNGASPIVRDVEQVFDREGSHGVAWCSSQAASRLTSALANVVVELGERAFLRAYRYRLIVYQGARLALQAVNPAASGGSVPDLIPVSAWSGLAGCVNKLAPGQQVFVAFDHTTEPAQPVIVGYSLTGLPLETTVDASTAVHLAPTASLVDLAGGGHPLAFADLLLAELVKIGTATGGAYVPPISPALIGSTKASSG